MKGAIFFQNKAKSLKFAKKEEGFAKELGKDNWFI